MERLRHDDPSQIGPYITLARFDAGGTEGTVPGRRCIARSGDGDHTVFVPIPHIGVDPSCWAVEAERHAGRHLPGKPHSGSR
ncbi:hypothetical protein [Streptomyces lunaelactis]|uniref:hypothetical protein n=1 Tax=Streptomyces lunaelactis TaxID=1535768 RepID=UPI001584574B|nr:hypothetical protein [Streptomyces lunaelactis]NUK03985.1 hypothetical protein [Streptomyces lunaelactis]NUK17010.1 hypothetical protein [Streptomyces lunaelactis]